MLTTFENTAIAVAALLRQTRYADRTLNDHRRCCEELRRHFSETGAYFSMEAAVAWLSGRKAGWTKDTYHRYRRALYRLDMYMRSGGIEREPHCHNNWFVYHDADVSYIKLPDHYKALFQEFHTKISTERSKGTVDHYIAGCTDFLLFISGAGCGGPGEITIAHVLAYAQRIHENQWSEETKIKYANGVSKLLAFFHALGHVPRCYSAVLCGPEREALLEMLVLPHGTGQAFQPSKPLEPLADTFLSEIALRRYSEPPQRLYGFVFQEFFLFLEVNHLKYTPDAACLWLEHIPRKTSWELRRHMIMWFVAFLRTGIAAKEKPATWKPLGIEGLPDWSRNILDGYLALRRREGWAESTLVMCRSSCVRFFAFLEKKGVACAGEITPQLVKEFHSTDPHATPESRNAYGSRVRMLLSDMADQRLVPQNLSLAISAQCAGRRAIVSVMPPEMESAIYRYRAGAAGADALRDTAMVLLGLRMGLRGSDIVNLKMENIDWQKRKISIVQTKTNKAVTLPLPTEVGNSIYRYITQGRPESGIDAAGYIFIRHCAPFSKMTPPVCRFALRRILEHCGMELPAGEGFHITRRSFATGLLKARTPVDGIADALGHATRQTVSVYLSHDEEGMRLCPLSFHMGGGA